MTPSPVKRYRSRSRLHTSDRAGLREQALKLAEKGLANRRGGPVDKGPVEAQKRAALQLRDRANSERMTSSHGGTPKSMTKTGEPTKDPTAPMGAMGRSRNNTNNERRGLLFRTIQRNGGEVHDYGGGRRVFVRKPAASRETGPTSGTYNHSLKPSGGSVAQGTLEKLAAQRATQNRPKSRRKLFARA